MWSETSVMRNKECYWLRVVLGAGSLGKSSRVCSVLCVRFRSNVETNKATADTRCTEPPHGALSTICDRLGRDMLETPGSALYRRLKGLGSGDPARSPTPTYKKCWCCGFVFCVSGQHAWPRPLSEGREQGWWRVSASDVDVLTVSWTVSRRLRQARYHHEQAPSMSGASCSRGAPIITNSNIIILIQ